MKVSEELMFLEDAFDVLNRKYFDSALSRPAITIQSTPGVHGHFTPFDAWESNAQKLKEINIGAESLRRPVPNVIATLMHEMVHYWCHTQKIQDTSRGNTYHNKRFKEEAEKRDLIISTAPLIGYSVTQPAPELVALVHKMNWENRLQLYRQRFGDQSSGHDGADSSANPSNGKKKSSTRKYICPNCGMSIRATKVVRVACMDCNNVQMVEAV